jgi:hypothetical protein
MRYVTVEVEVDLGDFDSEDLIDELEARGEDIVSSSSTAITEIVDQIWQNRRLGKDYQAELTELIYQVTGKIL